MENTLSTIAKQNVTVVEARRILGTRYVSLNDEELKNILRALYALSEKVIQNVTKTI